MNEGKHAASAATGIVDSKDFLQLVRPPSWNNPSPRSRYDLAVIGAGPAGIAAAEWAALRGFTVALLERSRVGGNSLNAGSVPSKAIIRSASIYEAMRDADRYGTPTPVEATPDIGNVMERMRAIRARIAEYHSVEKLTRAGIDVFFGEARFERPDAISVNESSLRFRGALIATGAHPRRPNIPGLEEIGYWTSDDIFETSSLPRRLLVIGGGPLGCEMAQAFCRLGLSVKIVQNDPKFLPREERDASEILSRAMARDGVEIWLNTTVVGARRDGDKTLVQTVTDDRASEMETDGVLLSIGRVPNVEALGLEAAEIGLRTDLTLEIDDFLCTTNPHVYAAGDVCMDLKFANAAQASARIAARNALLGERGRLSELSIPWCTFCDPEIAHIGMQVWQTRERHIPIESFTIMMGDVDRAITDGKDTGFMKLHIADGTDRIIGATIVASHASEMINELAVIVNGGIGMNRLADIVHTYPAQSESIMLAAREWVRAKGSREQSTSEPGTSLP